MFTNLSVLLSGWVLGSSRPWDVQVVDSCYSLCEIKIWWKKNWETKRYIKHNILTVISSCAWHSNNIQYKCHQEGQKFPSVPHPGTVQLNWTQGLLTGCWPCYAQLSTVVLDYLYLIHLYVLCNFKNFQLEKTIFFTGGLIRCCHTKLIRRTEIQIFRIFIFYIYITT